MDNPNIIYKLVRNDDGLLHSLAAPGEWHLIYTPGKWKRGRKGSKLFAVNGLELAVQYGVVERSVRRPVEIWEALGLEIEELCRFLTMDQGRWEAFWSGDTIGLWHEPPAGTVVVTQIKLVRKVWPED
jgi:hypothetical protein